MAIKGSARAGIILFVLAQATAGCNALDSPDPTDPIYPPAAPPAPPPAPPPPPAPIVPVLTVTAISPNLGSTGGSTAVTITGTGFTSDVTVSFGGAKVVYLAIDGPAPAGKINLYVPEHDPGTVDVIVTNPGGASVTVTGGYTYASAGSFDFNGSWSGYGGPGQDIPVLFTIRENALVSISCATFGTLTFTPALPVTNGEFAYSRADGVAVSGRIVSASQAVGTMNLAACANTHWGADKI